MTRESSIETYLRTELQKHGVIVRKWVSPGRKAVSDRLCFFRHPYLVIAETKAPGEDLRPDQVREQQRVNRLGWDTRKIDSRQAVRDLIDEMREKGALPIP